MSRLIYIRIIIHRSIVQTDRRITNDNEMAQIMRQNAEMRRMRLQLDCVSTQTLARHMLAWCFCPRNQYSHFSEWCIAYGFCHLTCSILSQICSHFCWHACSSSLSHRLRRSPHPPHWISLNRELLFDAASMAVSAQATHCWAFEVTGGSISLQLILTSGFSIYASTAFSTMTCQWSATTAADTLSSTLTLSWILL